MEIYIQLYNNFHYDDDIPIFENKNLFGNNWFIVVLFKLMIPLSYSTEHALYKTRSLQHQTPAQFIPLTN